MKPIFDKQLYKNILMGKEVEDNEREGGRICLNCRLPLPYNSIYCGKCGMLIKDKYLYEKCEQNRAYLKYYVDLVFCIDVTLSMKEHFDYVKKSIFDFCNEIMEIAEEEHRNVAMFRAKVVAFREFGAESENALFETDFFELPRQQMAFEAMLNCLNVDGDSDLTNGLEAIVLAINSNWNRCEMGRKRQGIIVFSDKGTHEIGHGSENKKYPQYMPRSMEELTVLWEQFSFLKSEWRVIFVMAPDEQYWDNIYGEWSHVMHYVSEAGNGLHEWNRRQICECLIRGD